MPCAAFQLQQMCFHHLGHRQRLVTMSYTFISFAQNAGRVFSCLQQLGHQEMGFFLPAYALLMPSLMSRNTSLVSSSSANLSLTNQIRSFQTINDQVICHGISVLILFVLMSAVFLLSPGQVHLPPAFVRCVQRWGLILLNSVGNTCTSIPPCAF